MSGRREAVEKNDRFADAPSPRRVIVEPNATDVDELTAHRGSRLAWCNVAVPIPNPS
jgi:hypothetical protein